MIEHNFYDILLNPIVTEKSTLDNEKSTYVFKVSLRASKKTVKKAVELVYGTDVDSVRILRQKGKSVRFKGVAGRRSSCKKAFVRLMPGKTIEIIGGNS